MALYDQSDRNKAASWHERQAKRAAAEGRKSNAASHRALAEWHRNHHGDLDTALVHPNVGRHYRHYKGGKYKVLNIARHTEESSFLVIYSDRQGRIWARPYSMFVDGRFQEIVPVVSEFERCLEILEDLPELIKERREFLKLSALDVSKESGVAQSTVSQFELRKWNPRNNSIMKLLQWYVDSEERVRKLL